MNNYILIMTIDGTVMAIQAVANIEHAASLIDRYFDSVGLTDRDEDYLSFDEMEGADPNPVWGFSQTIDPSITFEMWWQQATLLQPRTFDVVPKE